MEVRLEVAIIVILGASILVGVRCQVEYNGYQVIRVNTTKPEAFEVMKQIYLNEELDFWSSPSKTRPTDILLPPRRIALFTEFLKSLDIPFEVLIRDVEYELQFERLNFLGNLEYPIHGLEMNWTAYQRLETIHAWMDELAQKYPTIVTIYNVGKSTQKLPLKIMKISTGDSVQEKPAIWLDGGIHAREWISPATVTYIANELILQATRYRHSRLTNYFEFYVNPVMNPDGYEFTQVDRLWRKTRSGPRPIVGGFWGLCRGVDPNRNWDFQWGGEGTSDNPCSQIYHGPVAASEPEVKAMQDFIFERKDSIKLFLTFHSYSQLLLLPWGFDEVRTDDHDELMAVGLRALKALEAVHGTVYTAGNTAEVLYPAAGGSHDWAKGVAGIKFSYCYELRDTGNRGFLLPAEQIIPSGQETFAAVQSMAESMIEYYKLTYISTHGTDVGIGNMWKRTTTTIQIVK